MAADWLLIATIVVILAYLGKIKVPGNVRLDDRYDLNRARFHGPGRNARQQNLAEERKERRTRHEEEVVLGNVGGEGGAEKGEGIGEIEGGGKGDFVEHPGLARGVRDERALRVAAAEARMKKDKTNAELARRHLVERKAKKGRSALEQASAENVGWRNVDEVRETRSYN